MPADMMMVRTEGGRTKEEDGGRTDGRIELPLGGAALDGDGHTLGGQRDKAMKEGTRRGRGLWWKEAAYLDDFGSVGADHVRTDDSVGLSVDDQLHDALLIALGQRVLERCELGEVHVDLTELEARLLFGKADARDRRRSEDGCRTQQT